MSLNDVPNNDNNNNNNSNDKSKLLHLIKMLCRMTQKKKLR